MLLDIRCCRFVLFLFLVTIMGADQPLPDGEQSALCILARSELGQEPVVVRPEVDVRFPSRRYVQFSLRIAMFPLYIMLPCFMHSVQQVVIERIYPYLAGAPRPRRPQNTRHHITAACKQLLIQLHNTFCATSSLPSPSIVSLFIVLFVDDDTPTSRHRQACVHKYSPTWVAEAVLSVILNCIIRAAMCECPIHIYPKLSYDRATGMSWTMDMKNERNDNRRQQDEMNGDITIRVAAMGRAFHRLTSRTPFGCRESHATHPDLRAHGSVPQQVYRIGCQAETREQQIGPRLSPFSPLLVWEPGAQQPPFLFLLYH